MAGPRTEMADRRPPADVHPPDAAGTRTPLIETTRLLLRPWREDDAAGYSRRMLGDRGVMRHMGSGPLHATKRAAAAVLTRVSDLEARWEIDRLVGHWNRLGYGEWAVEEKASGALIGRIGLKHHPDWVAEPCQVEVGWMLARPAWGRGFATEGATASLMFAFEQLGLDRVICIVLVGNERSRRLAERLGLALQGSTRWHRSPVVWYAADRAAWERRQSGAQ